MSLYAIADLHLSFAAPKPMDIFGSGWDNHVQRLEENWKKTVMEADTVLIPGDISWAMDLKDAVPDLAFLQALPGQKILLPGNHDYWWESLSKLHHQFPDLKFLKNNFYPYRQGWAVCGARGWTCPNEKQFTVHDKKCYNREQIRLRLSLDAALRAGFEQIVVMLHYPPTNEKKEPSGFTEIFDAYPQVKKVVYGHLHGQGAQYAGLRGRVNRVDYILAAGDYLDFTPLEILHL